MPAGTDRMAQGFEQSSPWEGDGSDTFLTVSGNSRLVFREGPFDAVFPRFSTRMRSYSANPLTLPASLASDGASNGNGGGMYASTTAAAAASLVPQNSESIRVVCDECRFVGNLALGGLGGGVYAAGATDDDECTEVPAKCIDESGLIKANYLEFVNACPQDFHQNYAGGAGPDVSWTQVQPRGIVQIVL